MAGTSGAPALPVGRRTPDADATAPDGSQIRLLVGASHGATQSSVCEVLLPPGKTSRPVKHQSVEEVWHVLEGSGRVWRCPPDADPERVPPIDVRPGDTLVILTGWAFQFAAGEAAALRFLCHTTPPWPGDHEAIPLSWGALGPATV